MYYDLDQERRASENSRVAIHRLEQLYPLHQKELDALLSPYTPGTEIVWVQEEPLNMGAWPSLRLRFGESVCDGRHPLTVVARPASASPATGSSAAHKLEQSMLINEALNFKSTRTPRRKAATGKGKGK